MTLPRAVFLKNFRCVTTASSRGRFRMDISTMRSGRLRRDLDCHVARSCLCCFHTRAPVSDSAGLYRAKPLNEEAQTVYHRVSGLRFRVPGVQLQTSQGKMETDAPTYNWVPPSYNVQQAPSCLSTSQLHSKAPGVKTSPSELEDFVRSAKWLVFAHGTLESDII